MSSNNVNSTSSGIGFCGLLTIVFIVLKITGFIDWSWIWVLSPICIPLVLTIVFLIVLALVFLIGRRK